MKAVDAADIRILSVLQEDGSLSAAEVAERVHLSTNACWRRMRRLETEGIIRKRVALIEPEAVGLSVSAFVRVRLADHKKNVRAFVDAMSQLDEVTEICSMPRDHALLLRTYSSSLVAHGHLIERIAGHFPTLSIESDFVTQSLYQTTALPI